MFRPCLKNSRYSATATENAASTILNRWMDVKEILATETEALARAKASAFLQPLSEEERARIYNTMYGGADNDIVGSCDAGDSVQRRSFATLRPRLWLNDEVIHCFLQLLSSRDAKLYPDNRSHFFKSFFVTKLRNEGHPQLHGMYDYKNVKRWSKQVHKKDIFSFSKIFFPVNQGNKHWTLLVAFMKEKRIQFYDSMGGSGKEYLNAIYRYLQDEHLDKKKCELPGDWELRTCDGSTPRQLNGYDCGVFTCMFADFLSTDSPFVFGQDHVTHCRERIALAILNGKAL